MAENIEDLILRPCVARYNPTLVRNLEPGTVKLWCTCGLSKAQPWCDNSHIGTGFKPLKWTVAKSQSMFSICNCKYTQDPPYCDGTHVNLPSHVLKRQSECEGNHQNIICTQCGFTNAREDVSSHEALPS